jgi:hypothetical protein
MKKTILRFGTYAGIFELVCFALVWLVIKLFPIDHGTQGNIGLVAITCPLIFVYVGIRYYRDKLNDGSISFLKALRLGLLIVIIPALSYALVETVYVLYIDPQFYDKVFAYDIEQYRKTLPPAAFALKAKALKAELAMDKNPFYNFSLMVLIIGCLGVIVSLISSLLLMRKSGISSDGRLRQSLVD